MPKKTSASDTQPQEQLVFRACELFFRTRCKPANIAERLSEEFGRPIRRESVYPLLLEARDRGFVQFHPPLDQILQHRVAERYGFAEEQFTVVATQAMGANHALVEATADLVMQLIKSVAAREGRAVGLGLGPGRATLDFSRALSHRLWSDPTSPKLRLHALTAGCPTHFPKYAPISFFNLFPSTHIEESVGLFAEALVKCEEYARIVQRVGVQDALEMRDRVDIVVTSMGDMNHPHDLYRWFLEQGGMDVQTLLARGWIGNVQYRPYHRTGPAVEQPCDQRAVTLFELSDYVDMVTKGRRHVVLMAPPCSRCGEPRTRALQPLLTESRLKVWSHLVTDLNTARALIAEA